MAQLEGKVAIVTGGGRGIGRAHAIALAREGAAVVVNDLGVEFSGEGSATRGPADEVVAEIVAAGGRAVADTTDISDWDAVAGLVETAISAFGRLDIVLNNAAITRFGTIDAISRDDWERTIAVNLTGTAALCHWAAKHWREKGPEAGRRIINTSSGVGLTPHPGNPMYTAAKAGVAAIAISMAIELAELGVRVNAIAPVARSRISKHVAGALMDDVAEGFDPVAPEHIAAVGVYLASPACAFTGRTIGIIGDSVTLFDGWSVAHEASSNRQDWTVESMRKALEGFPAQQTGWTQSLPTKAPLLTPTDEVLKQLAAVEGA